MNINNIENVEGKYHLMFLEGRNIVDGSKNELRYAWFSLLLFLCMILVFIILGGLNLYLVGFLAVFLVIFLAYLIYLCLEKKKGVSQCIYAVQNSSSNDIIARQIDNRKANRAVVSSLSSTLDRYDAKEKFPTFAARLKRKRKHDHLVDAINNFERENKKEE